MKTETKTGVVVGLGLLTLSCAVGCGGKDDVTQVNVGTGGSAAGSGAGGTGAAAGSGGGNVGGTSGSGGAGRCADGLTYCDGVGCVNLQTSEEHCGTCDNECSLPHATPVCENGECRIESCQSPYEDCDELASTGCEADVTADAKHCGTCENACSSSFATPACESSTCVIETCDSGHDDCNHDANDGCETDLTSDATNCGSCQASCTNPNGTTACVQSVCVPECTGNGANCDADPNNGCETDLQTDAKNCGTCGFSLRRQANASRENAKEESLDEGQRCSESFTPVERSITSTRPR